MKASSGRGAVLVAAGIFASRVFGLVRERVLAHYLGNSVAAAAFKAGLRIPNLLQNLFGEGVLAASFIPVYAELLGKGEKEAADRVASAVLSLLSVAVSILVVLGVLGSPWLVDVIAPGFTGEGRALAVQVVRILFPGMGLLVISAWCLGVLNSHRRFFLSYVAPVIWNLAIIAALILGRSESLESLAIWAAYGTLVGSLLQLLVQLPTVMTLVGRLRPTLAIDGPVRQVLISFVPVVLGRGVANLSAFIDTAFATLVSTRALSALTYGQTLYMLPVSLFGMAVSAAELPEMSQVQGQAEEVAEKLRARIQTGLSRISFFVIPSAFALIAFGDVLGAALFQTGRFTSGDARYLWYILAGAGVGLLASTSGRLYASAFYAQKDTRTPLYFALVRVALTGTLGYAASLRLPGFLGLPLELGAVGITLTSSLAAWVELGYLRHRLEKKIGPTRLAKKELAGLGLAALLASMGAIAVKLVLVGQVGADQGSYTEWSGAFLPVPMLHPIITMFAMVMPFGAIYFGVTSALGSPIAKGILRRVLRRA